MMKLSITLLVAVAVPAMPQQPTHPRPVILVTANIESITSKTASGAATNVGGVVIAGGGSNTSTYEHSEVWEVVRRFAEECPIATFVTNPDTPHTLTIHTDYEKVHSLVVGSFDLYQLVLLDPAGNPLFIAKKNYLRRQVKPVCRIIEAQAKP